MMSFIIQAFILNGFQRLILFHFFNFYQETPMIRQYLKKFGDFIKLFKKYFIFRETINQHSFMIENFPKLSSLALKMRNLICSYHRLFYFVYSL